MARAPILGDLADPEGTLMGVMVYPAKSRQALVDLGPCQVSRKKARHGRRLRGGWN